MELMPSAQPRSPRVRSSVAFVAGLTIGTLAAFAAPYVGEPRAAHAAHAVPTTVRRSAADSAPRRVTLYRFEMNDGAAGAFDNWMRWHRANRAPIIATLEREHMYVEAMFRDTVGQPGVIYWLTVDGPGAQSVDDSPLAIDREHLAFMREVIRKGSRRVLTTEFSLTPPFLDSAIAQHRALNP